MPSRGVNLPYYVTDFKGRKNRHLAAINEGSGLDTETLETFAAAYEARQIVTVEPFGDLILPAVLTDLFCDDSPKILLQYNYDCIRSICNACGCYMKFMERVKEEADELGIPTDNIGWLDLTEEKTLYCKLLSLQMTVWHAIMGAVE